MIKILSTNLKNIYCTSGGSIEGFDSNFLTNNSFQNGTELISVPHPQKSLQIETLTFRDKLQPGVEETWRFKIKGPKGEKEKRPSERQRRRASSNLKWQRPVQLESTDLLGVGAATGAIN